MIKQSHCFSYTILCSLAILLLVFSSCSITKNLEEDEYLYMGTNINVADEKNAISVESFESNTQNLTPTPTSLGIGNVYLGLYNLYDETKETGFKNWVKNKLGKEPVMFDPIMIERTEDKFVYYLNGKGFFNNDVSCDSIIEDTKKINIECAVTLNKRYVVDSVVFPIDSTYAALKLDRNLQRVIINEGAYYDRDRLDYERFRLSTLAGDLGFADFVSDNVYYYVDTLKGNHSVDVYVKIIQPTDSTTHIRYTLDSINIFPNYTIETGRSGGLKKITIAEGINVYESDHYLNHELLDRLILEDPNWFYNRTLEQKSLNRLLDLGLFKFINIENIPTKPGHFVQNIYLTPEKMQSVSAEVELNNRSGNILGTGASVKYQHLNLFKNGERLNVSLGGQVETQFGNGLNFVNSSDLNGSAEIAFPRFIVPFVDIKEGISYIPRTVVRSNFTYQRRTQYYTLQSLNARYGYKWREKASTFHEVYPIVINQVNVRNKSKEFQELLTEDPRLLTSFENVLIAGLQYYYIFSNQANRSDKSYNYFRGELETSGNLLSIFRSNNNQEPAQIAGFNYAQFTKVTLDFRNYFSLGNNGTLATRILVGAGLAYGNSEELPYIKQYLIGGSNSIRAFRLRGLGPGGYFSEQDNLDVFSAQFIDQTGDTKLEMNAEYRFPIFSYLKGAAFVDAGNVWLLNNKDRPEGNLEFNDFYKEIAIGTGLGIRVDFDFFLIRVDMAFPLRGPTINNDFEWKFADINPFIADWRQKNLRFNLGIGYPF